MDCVEQGLDAVDPCLGAKPVAAVKNRSWIALAVVEDSPGCRSHGCGVGLEDQGIKIALNRNGGPDGIAGKGEWSRPINRDSLTLHRSLLVETAGGAAGEENRRFIAGADDLADGFQAPFLVEIGGTKRGP